MELGLLAWRSLVTTSITINFNFGFNIRGCACAFAVSRRLPRS
jgi:hypothetical protein